VLQHFGAEAPALLNAYACTIEDALVAQANQSIEALQQIEAMGEQLRKLEIAFGAAAEDNQAFNTLCTDPELLSEYVVNFFGPEGPYPVQTAQDRLRADVEASNMGYQRPQMEITPPAYQQQESLGDFWSELDRIGKVAPQNLWRVLDMAPAGALTSKLLVSPE